MATKFTPGPWTVRRMPGEIFNVLVESESGKAIAECFVNAEAGLAEGIAETNANVRLIAASPELYSALIKARSFVLKHATTNGDEKAAEIASETADLIRKINNTPERQV
ncbi:hypothetical protein [Nitrosomonas marina]|uniref:Uncharacterized protein n=1 Tax=Nitrosomonas marina TaxID=917 RepID=A0A1H8IT90_9PROT|nr:hypothetical protein [Nitrosomonas marina]SEN71774.1 hypothetical protein SAMN05216325_14012 [Nitrosomonas marina]